MSIVLYKIQHRISERVLNIWGLLRHMKAKYCLEHLREGLSGMTLKVSEMSQPNADIIIWMAQAPWSQQIQWLWGSQIAFLGFDIEDLKNQSYGPVVQLPLNQLGAEVWLSHRGGTPNSTIGFSRWQSNKPHSLPESPQDSLQMNVTEQHKTLSSIKHRAAKASRRRQSGNVQHTPSAAAAQSNGEWPCN